MNKGLWHVCPQIKNNSNQCKKYYVQSFDFWRKQQEGGQHVFFIVGCAIYFPNKAKQILWPVSDSTYYYIWWWTRTLKEDSTPSNNPEWDAQKVGYGFPRRGSAKCNRQRGFSRTRVGDEGNMNRLCFCGIKNRVDFEFSRAHVALQPTLQTYSQ